MTAVALVALGGVIGSLSRYRLDLFVQHRTRSTLPIGTTLINVSGAFALGLLSGLHSRHGLSTDALVLAGTGFCGAFTTFSTLMYELSRLVEERALLRAVAVLAANLLPGLLLAALGLAVTGAL
jgi:CrcB protein